MRSWLTLPLVSGVLDGLYADAAANDPLVRKAAREAGAADEQHPDHYTSMRMAYMPVSRPFGNLLYNLARAARAERSLSSARRSASRRSSWPPPSADHGAGRVITTEASPEKADRARRNLAAVELDSFVEVRVGDARQTLRDGPAGGIDLVFLDGAKSMYLEVLRLLEHRIRRGGIVASDNTDHAGLAPFLDYVRTTANGFTSSALLTPGDHGPRGHEVTIRN